MADHSIAHTEHDSRGAFFVEQDGKRVAELTYRRVSTTLVNFDHVEVADSLAGQGVGRRLLDAAVNWARETRTKVRSTCSYASSQFAKDPSIRDVLD